MPFQEAAIPMLEPTKVLNEMKALQTHFRNKRDYVLGRLKDLGFKIKNIPDSTFYIWLDLSDLPAGINDGLNFFQKCLEQKVIGKNEKVTREAISDMESLYISSRPRDFL